MKILLMNGPNLNLTGTRRPEIYGHETLADIVEQVKAEGRRLGVEVVDFQSNHEGDLIDRLHTARGECDGVILNAGALTHYSYALRDAIEAIELPCIEVHMSDIHAREDFRKISVIRDVCCEQICGHGKMSYLMALHALKNRIGE